MSSPPDAAAVHADAPHTSPIVWRLTALMALTLIALTAADISTTLVALRGHGLELNPHARDGQGGINVGYIVLVNFVVLVPLVLGYFVAMRAAHRVPGPVLDHWWRHIFDIFTVAPRSDAGRARSPLRLATAAMVMIVLKALIVGSNLLAVLRIAGPTTYAASLFSGVGLTGYSLWQAAYVVLVVPCYMAAVGLGALTLSAVQRDRAAKGDA